MASFGSGRVVALDLQRWARDLAGVSLAFVVAGGVWSHSYVGVVFGKVDGVSCSIAVTPAPARRCILAELACRRFIRRRFISVAGAGRRV